MLGYPRFNLFNMSSKFAVALDR